MIMELNFSHFSIRNWRHGDQQSLVRHANNRKIWLNVRDRFPHPYTLADADGWIKKVTSDPSCHDFAIAVDDVAVGGISIFLQTDIFRRSAEIGYWLGEEFWGRGIVTEAVRAMTEYAFSNFDICRIYAGVFEWNPASMRVLEKAGYEFESRTKKSVTKNGQTMDEFIYAIVR
jgi:Acetyltransferases, including N-acetylases of ribosomal proteins